MAIIACSILAPSLKKQKLVTSLIFSGIKLLACIDLFTAFATNLLPKPNLICEKKKKKGKLDSNSYTT